MRSKQAAAKTRHVHRLALMALAAVCSVTGCTSPTPAAPAEIAALAGPWSSGHSLIGLSMVLDLAWTSDSVRGSGSYVTLKPVVCGGVTLDGSGTVQLLAARTSDTTVRGSMTFGTAWRPSYEGTLRQGSFIDGVIAPGAAPPCPFTLFRGVVP